MRRAAGGECDIHNGARADISRHLACFRRCGENGPVFSESEPSPWWLWTVDELTRFHSMSLYKLLRAATGHSHMLTSPVLYLTQGYI